MSQFALSVDDRPVALPFPALVEALAALSVSFTRRGEDLALKNSGALTAELKAAVADHKRALLALCDCRAELNAALALTQDRIVTARCQDPKKGTRAAGLAWLARQVAAMTALSVEAGGTAGGWPDPGDPFAYGDQLTGLRADLAELSRAEAPYPVPLPAGCVLLPQANFDPFEHGRSYSGKVIGGGAVL